MNKKSKIYVAGHNGMVGSAIIRHLKHEGYTNVIDGCGMDLKRQEMVEGFFAEHRPDYVFLCAAKVGGIIANSTYPANFIYDNLMIQSNVIHAAYQYGVKKFLFLGSSCIYPKYCPQPIREEYLLSSSIDEDFISNDFYHYEYLEPTNEPYAVAKIAGIKMCQAYNKQYEGTKYICGMPTNLYGPGDTYDIENSHVIPALIKKFTDAKKSNGDATILGTGSVWREFLYVEDLADACVFLMNNPDAPEIINVGTGEDIQIYQLGNLISEILEFKGPFRFDDSKPDGTPRKLLDVTKMKNLGWEATTDLKIGLAKTILHFMSNVV